MGDKSQGHLPPIWVFLQPFSQRIHVFQHHRMLAPTGDGFDLRVVRGTDDHRSAAILLRLRDQLVNAGDIGTGGVQNGVAMGLQQAIDLLGLAVGTDEHLESLRRLLRHVDLTDSLIGQMLHHMAVMDDGAQHHTGGLLFRLLLGQLHRPADAVTKTGAFRKDDCLHSASSPKA